MKTTPLYVELHARSAFSFLRGASTPAQLAGVAAQCDLSALALCDRDGVYGAPRLYERACQVGIRPLVGAEITLANNGGILPVLVTSPIGYRNLCLLLSRSQQRTAKGTCSTEWDDLACHADGLIALSGGSDGPLLQSLANGGHSEAAFTCRRLIETFGKDNVYIELQRQRIRGEERVIRFLTGIASAHDLPLVATGGVAFATPSERAVLDAFTCIRSKVTLDQAGRQLEQNANRHLRSPAAMHQLFADIPEALDNTLRIAERIDFTLANLGYRFPRYPVPAGESMDSFLRKITNFGAEQRYGSLTPPVRRQLTHELDLIARLGFSGYFLIVWDIVNFCRERGIMVQGRGSAANSAVCYSLGITAVDPVGSKLLFERFLSEGRRTWPDIDLDLPSGRQREAVIQEVFRRYGRNGAAMAANVITYRGRSTFRELGKILAIPQSTTDRLSRLFGSGDYPHTLDTVEHLKKAGLDVTHPREQALLKLFNQVHGLPRHLGQHSGGMIICEGELDGIVPLEPASMPGRQVTQWDKDDCENLGIIKIDLLGLGMMAVMSEALELTRQRGHPVDLARIPKDDGATYDMICVADTIGVFQIESRAQMATLPRMLPRTFYDLVIEVAIIRPGPIQGDLIHPFLDRRAGRQPIDMIDEKLRPVLERTLGVPLFQEQVMQMAMIMAEFSATEADELRKALGFKRDDERTTRVEAKLRKALEQRKVEESKIRQITGALRSFALYGFPESHAISFALIAYASAYLKRHYPAEFYTALLNNQPMGFYRPPTIIQDAKRHGMRILPPCIHNSDLNCKIEDDHTLRLGLASVHAVTTDHRAAIIEQRGVSSFRDLTDFRRRCPLRSDELRALSAVGALNCLGGDRRSTIWRTARPIDSLPLIWADDAAPAPLHPMSAAERLSADYSGLGLTVGAHPMKHLRPHLPGILTAAGLRHAANGCRASIAGAVICRQRPGTAKGVVFISLEDETGVANVIVPSKLFEQNRLLISQERFLTISGTVQSRDNVVHILARTIQPMQCTQLPSAGSHDFR